MQKLIRLYEALSLYMNVIILAIITCSATENPQKNIHVNKKLQSQSGRIQTKSMRLGEQLHKKLRA